MSHLGPITDRVSMHLAFVAAMDGPAPRQLPPPTQPRRRALRPAVLQSSPPEPQYNRAAFSTAFIAAMDAAPSPLPSSTPQPARQTSRTPVPPKQPAPLRNRAEEAQRFIAAMDGRSILGR